MGRDVHVYIEITTKHDRGGAGESDSEGGAKVFKKMRGWSSTAPGNGSRWRGPRHKLQNWRLKRGEGGTVIQKEP